jgi:cellulose synthase/poly-beta-1,6-N-acetylglucosamine synthase-like glycosyltransferase
MRNQPLVTAIIPIRSKERPELVLDYLGQADVEPGLLQIILVEGKSPSLQRNEAVARAKGEFVYFLDDDSYVDKHCIAEGLRYLKDTDVAVVGGPAITHDRATLFETCSGLVMSSLFGGLMTRARNIPCGEPRAVKGDELIGCNLMVRKADFQRVGGMDARFHPGEEVEFLRRLREAKKLLYYNPKMLVSRTRRKLVNDLIHQFIRYGNARGLIVFGSSPKISDVIYFLPSFFLIYLALLSLLPSLILSIPLLLYMLLACLAAGQIGWKNRSALLAALAFPLFFVLHLSYGLGVLLGALHQLAGSSNKSATRVCLTELQSVPQFPNMVEVNP